MAQDKTNTPAPLDDEAVGYGRPPTHSRFRPGQFGNPKGRPIGARNKPKDDGEALSRILIEEAMREISVTNGGRSASMPLIRVAARMIGMKAAKGDIRAFRVLADPLAAKEKFDEAKRDEWNKGLTEYKFEMLAKMDAWRALGRSMPELLPHPDDIVFNKATGWVEARGPLFEEDKERWEMIYHLIMLEACERTDMQDLIRRVAGTKNPKIKARLSLQLTAMEEVTARVSSELEGLSAELKAHRLRRIAAIARL